MSTASRDKPSNHSRTFLNNFLKVFLPLTLVLFLIALVYFVTQTRSHRAALEVEQTGLVEYQHKLISSELDSIIGDLLFLADHNELQDYLDSPDAALKTAVANEYLLFAARKGIYDQVRFLDETGMEVVRVNYNAGDAVVVPDEALQFKGDRYYFDGTMQLEAGEVLVSPFDLNIEHGQVEQPLKPVIRFGVAVIDRQGQKRGIVVLNYLGGDLLRRIEETADGSTGEVMLLNEAGYWLSGPDPEAEWGFMFEDKQHLTLANSSPQAWEQIIAAESGQFETRDGLYTYVTITPFDEGQVGSEDYVWKIVSVVGPETLSAAVKPSLQTLALIAIPFFLGLTAVSWNFARARAVQEQASDAIQLTAKVFESTSEGIFITDEHGLIVNANQAFSTITGYPVNEVVGQNPRIFKSERHDDEFYESFWKALLEHKRWQGEIWNRKKDGVVYPAWLRISAMEDEQGEVVHYVAVYNDITERKQIEQRLEFLATHDPLTNLPNRALFNDRVRHAVELASRSENKAAMMFLDLDGFKEVNDSLGHEAGDQLLMDLSTRLREQLRESDTLARLGGDEFAFVIENINDRAAAEKVARKILGTIAETMVIDGQAVSITGSLGVCIYPDNGEEVEVLLKNADTAMYRAKGAGRNQYWVCEEN
jgi:diguanylate cyclase (GGDEF)-like protein/PAS domain S-box-containing protein